MKILVGFLILILISGSINLPGTSIITTHAEEQKIFPDWVKTVFKFWANEAISDGELKNALEYLLKEKILDLTEPKTTDPKTTESTINGGLLSTIKIDDNEFFTKTTEIIADVVKKVKGDPALDLLATTLLPEIPIVGGLLSTIYGNASGTTEDKNGKVLEILEKYEKMDEVRLKQAFLKLDANKDAIQNNTYLLDNLLVDTKQILEYTSDTNTRVKSLESKLDQISAQLTEIKIGKSSTTITPELKVLLNEITQLKSEIKDDVNFDTVKLEALAKTLALQKDFDGALAIYDQILQQDPTNNSALKEKGWTLYEQKKDYESVAAFNKLLEAHPNDDEGWEGKGWALLEVGSRAGEARESFLKALELDGASIDAMIGLGWAYYDEKNCNKAQSIFQKALDLEPGNEELLEAISETKFGC